MAGLYISRPRGELNSLYTLFCVSCANPLGDAVLDTLMLFFVYLLSEPQSALLRPCQPGPGMQRTENKLQFVGEKMPELKLRFAARLQHKRELNSTRTQHLDGLRCIP
jgi:hypothetical protein